MPIIVCDISYVNDTYIKKILSVCEMKNRDIKRVTIKSLLS